MQYVYLFLALVYISAVFGQDILGNPWDTPANATEADENESQFQQRLLGGTQVFLRETSWSLGSALGATTYTRSDMDGTGAFWNVVNGVAGVWIDVRQTRPAYTADELLQAGATLSNNRLVYNLTYVNQYPGLEIIHAHGQQGSYKFDGTPLLSAMPISSGESTTYTYDIDVTTNSGTYFLHSHWGMSAVQGMSAPLIIQADVNASYPLASRVNNPDIQEVLMYLEDWCLVYTNADDAETPGDTETEALTTDRFICQDPMLAYRAVWGEW